MRKILFYLIDNNEVTPVTNPSTLFIFRKQARHVRAGITNLTDNNHKQQRIVADVIAHPLYSNKKYHDIGLLRLQKKFDLDTWVRPACLHTEKNLPYAKALASGWGKIDFAGDDSKDLLKVKLEIFPVDKCNQTYRRDIIQIDSPLKDGIIDDLMICAGSSTENKDTCQVKLFMCFLIFLASNLIIIFFLDISCNRCLYD